MTNLPVIGSYVADLERNKIGEVMARQRGCLQLRRIRGGLEWDAKPTEVRRATMEEVLNDKVEATNAEEGEGK
ncbi:hypothetical protein [Streptomyces luteireticuli]|uniref:hypothetical protein n=1 Tax=Streptomyces luteireticuli TaxID=173858 RepID=UPI0035579000